MKSIKQTGICMDHSTANLIEFSNGKMEIKTFNNSPAFLGPLENLRLNESRMNDKDQKNHSEFYKRLSDALKDYDEVLLFGASNAKTEFFNLLKEDIQFNNIKIDVKSSDKMTETQQEDFVKNFFDRKM